MVFSLLDSTDDHSLGEIKWGYRTLTVLHKDPVPAPPFCNFSYFLSWSSVILLGGCSARHKFASMRNQTASTSASTWREFKDRGRDAFNAERYHDALSAYRSALAFPSVPDAERQVCLSNVVACRLKIGGPAMASAAVEEAKQCVAINDRWAKGHVRLASAYIAQGGHSNDACNALQKCISLDPSNTTARTMLMAELRRDRVARSAGDEGSGAAAGAAGGTAASAEDIDPSTGQPYSSQYRSNQTAAAAADIDESPTMAERVQFSFTRIVRWYYHDLTDDGRTLMKVLLGLVVLYVGMGGRFGLDSLFGGGDEHNRGNYEYGSAYDRFHGRAGAGTSDSASSAYTSGGTEGSTHGYGHGAGQGYGGTGRNTYDRYEYIPRGRSGGGGNSYHVPNLFDGSPLSIAVLLIFGVTCHYFGMNPFHALWMLNIFTGNRGRGMNRMGMMGMGYGMMNGGMRRRRGG